MKRLLCLLLAGCGSGAVTDPSTVPAPQPTPTIAPEVLIQPSDKSCAPGLCSGGDALVTATIKNAMGPRTVRFTVQSGPIGIIGPGGSFTMALDTTTDAQDAAAVRIRAQASAPTQTAVLGVTDVATGAFQRASVVVVQTTSPTVLVVPSVVTFAGPDTNTCSSSASTDVYLFGGTPPYIVGSSPAFSISPNVVPASGQSFNVQARGACANAPIPITDSAGRVSTVILQNQPGVNPAPTQPPLLPVAVAPTTVTLGNCSTIADVSVVGGTGAYTVHSSDHDAIYAFPNGANTITIGRQPTGTAVEQSAVSVQSGNSLATIDVQVPAGALTCPPP